MNKLYKIILLSLLFFGISISVNSAVIDHFMYLTDDLSKTVESFKKLDKNLVIKYGSSSKNAYNALLLLKNGTYIELLEPSNYPNKKRVDFNRIAFNLKIGKHFGLYAFDTKGYSKNLVSDFNQTFGYMYPNYFQMSRLRADNIKLNWSLTASDSIKLPQLIADETDIKYRNFVDEYPESTRKVSLKSFYIASYDIGKTKEMLSKLSNNKLKFSKKRISMQYTQAFCAKDHGTDICVLAPTSNNSEIFKFLANYGEGLYSFTLDDGIKILSTDKI
ncbi:MAG: hypothetical protein ACI8TE_001018 [Francisella sp.]|jgi:hypothetical protein